MVNSPEQQPLKRYTYAEYITGDEGIRRELIDGVPYINYEQILDSVPSAMAVPSTGHQSISGESYGQLW